MTYEWKDADRKSRATLAAMVAGHPCVQPVDESAETLDRIDARLERAAYALEQMREHSTSPQQQFRLAAKADGVRLARSYVADAKRGVW